MVLRLFFIFGVLFVTLTSQCLLLCEASAATAKDGSDDARLSPSSTFGRSKGGRRTLAVALMHRHGARTGPHITSEGLEWGNAVLSRVGEEMSLGLGKWLRKHYEQPYNESSSSVGGGGVFCAPDPTTGVIPLSSPSCIGRDYHDSQIISQSTYFERTIRTAMGMIRGMFPSDERAYPFIQHAPAATDMKLGYYYSWPSAAIHQEEILNYNAEHNNQTLQIISQSELDEVGEALSSQERCRTQQTLCILLAQDVTSCNYANDPQDDNSSSKLPEALLKHWPKFRSAQQRSNAFLYMYNNPSQQPEEYKKNNPKNLLQSSELWEKSGAFGRIFTREVASLFRQKLDDFHQESRGKSTTDEQKMSPLLYHYSAHDVTIYGVQVAMGGITVTDMYAPTDSPFPHDSEEHDQFIKFRMPEFASVLMFDLLEDGNVSVNFARPPQVFGADFTQFTLFSKKVVLMTCMDESGLLYKASECTLEDFTRFTDCMKPSPSIATEPQRGVEPYDGYDSHSYCYALSSDLVAANCERTSTKVPTDSACLNYRRVCPSFACEGPRFVLDASSLACKDMKEPEEANERWRLLYGGVGSSRTLWFYCGTILGSLLLGVVFGVVVRLMLYERSVRLSRGNDLAVSFSALPTEQTKGDARQINATS